MADKYVQLHDADGNNLYPATAPSNPNIYTAAFIAETASSIGTHLTATITVPAGTYELIGTLPVPSVNTGAFAIRDGNGNVVNNRFTWAASQGSCVNTVVTVAQDTSYYLSWEASVSCNFTYKERGGLQAVRLGGGNLALINAEIPLSVANGGTGGDISAFLDSFITVYFSESNNTAENAWAGFTETKTVHGNGYVFISISVETDDANSYGTTGARITNAGDTMSYSVDIKRYPSAYNQRQGASASCFLKVSDGDTFRISLGSTRGGTKYYKRNYACFGCTLT